MLFSPCSHAERRFWEFFTAHIRNPNTRLAYLTASRRFAAWCERWGLVLHQIEPVVVAAYVEHLTSRLAAPSVKQHLAALRMLFDWLVVGQVLPFNPAYSVRGPKHVVKSGKTPVSGKARREFLDLVKKAATDAKTNEGWFLTSVLGTRIRKRKPGIRYRDYGHRTLIGILKAYPNDIETKRENNTDLLRVKRQ